MATIRPIESADITALCEAFADDPADPRNRHAQRLGWHRAGDITYLVAWDGARPVGYVFVRWPGGAGELTEQAASLGCAEIADLTVAEHARGRGIGRQLMEAAEEQAKARGTAQLGLEVTAANPNQNVARLLYDKLGYGECGFGCFISGYTYWDANGQPQRDEELYIYLVKAL